MALAICNPLRNCKELVRDHQFECIAILKVKQPIKRNQHIVLKLKQVPVTKA